MSERTEGAPAPSSLRQLRRTVERLDELTRARDELVREALAADVPAKDIAAVLGVSPQRIYQIRDGRR